MFNFLIKNPFISISGVCLLLFITAGIFFNTMLSAPTVQYIVVTVILSLCCPDFFQRFYSFLLALIFVAIHFAFAQEYNIVLLIGELFIAFFVCKNLRTHTDAVIFLVFLLSFFLHLYYIQCTPIDVRQHDTTGIMYYMMQITRNIINFWEFNPWQMYYLFHQPLHFIILGYLYFLELFIWGSTVLAQEGLQYLSLFYVSSTILLFIKILKAINFSGIKFYATLCLFAFNPTLFLFSGYISDDTPVLLWITLFIYQLILWYQTDLAKHMVFAALAFSLGVLTKLSILTLVPAVVFLFLYKLINSTGKRVIFFHLCLFVSIAVPLSLLWIIRNHILFDMQFYNIPDTSPSGQNFYYQTFADRIFNFSNLGMPFINAPYFSDSNMWLALIKTELFGEWDLSVKAPVVYIPALILYCINIIIYAICFILSIYFICLTFKKGILPINSFFVIIYITVLLYSFKYAIDYPYVCSSDYRLFSALLISQYIILSSLFKTKYAHIMFLVSSICYAFLSSFIYMNL